MSLSDQRIAPFQPEVETVLEFLERFKMQCHDELNDADTTDVQKAALLIKALPVSIVTDIHRGLKPTKLSEAKYADITAKLQKQYEVTKSIVAASYSFVSRKQKPGESIEQFAQSLNNLADECDYKPCCRSRYLRDIFVAGLNSSSTITSLLHQDCDNKDFKYVVDKAKTIEAFSSDVQNIKFERKQSQSYKVKADYNKFNSSSKEKDSSVPDTYVCIRCNAKKSHFANNCFAKNLICKKCNKKGHIAAACRSKGSPRANAVHEETSSGQIKDSTARPNANRYPATSCTCDNRPASTNNMSSENVEYNSFDNFLA